MGRKGFLVGLAVVGICLGTLGAAADSADELLSQAAALYDTQDGAFDFAAYEGRLREAIRLYEEALPLLADDAARLPVLHQLARANFELANTYVFVPVDQEATYAAGKDYALAALRMDPEFVEREKKSFRDALSNADDLEAVFWYGTNFGSYLNFHQWETILYGWMGDVSACYERALALDETYLAGCAAAQHGLLPRAGARIPRWRHQPGARAAHAGDGAGAGVPPERGRPLGVGAEDGEGDGRPLRSPRGREGRRAGSDGLGAPGPCTTSSRSGEPRGCPPTARKGKSAIARSGSRRSPVGASFARGNGRRYDGLRVT